MNRAPNSLAHPNGWRFAGAARGFSFWKNGKQYRITPAADPCKLLGSAPTLGICLARAAVLAACSNLPVVEIVK